MYFDSLQDLIQMAGHGKYVWGCVILSTVLIAILFGIARAKFKQQHKLNAQLNNLPK